MALHLRNRFYIYNLCRPVFSSVHIDKHVRAAGNHLGPSAFNWQAS